MQVPYPPVQRGRPPPVYPAIPRDQGVCAVSTAGQAGRPHRQVALAPHLCGQCTVHCHIYIKGITSIYQGVCSQETCCILVSIADLSLNLTILILAMETFLHMSHNHGMLFL